MHFEVLWLIALGVSFHSALYCISRVYLAQWLYRALSKWRDQRSKDTHSPDQSRKYDSVTVTATEGQLAEIAQLIVGVVFASIASVFGVVILVQCRDDVMNQQSWVLAPFAHFGAWYYLIDCFTMYEAHRLQRHAHSPPTKALCSFVKRRWSIIGHHVLLFCLAYPLAVNYSVRRGKGDFVVGALIAEEWSTPLLSAVKILRLFGLQNSLVYRLIGVALLLVFFLVRVANLPLVILLYAAQSHNGSLSSALATMTPVCHLFNGVQLLLQTYWFFSLLRIAASNHCKRQSTHSNGRQPTKSDHFKHK